VNKKGKKISIIGVGNVGATIAYTLTIDGMASEIVLVDLNREKARGEAMDIIQGTPFSHHANIYADDFPAIADSDVVVIAAGIGRKPGQSRMELAQTNIDIFKGIVPELVRYTPDAVFLVISNPVDVLTYAVTKLSGLPESQIIGSGTMLDTARLRTALSKHVNLPPQNVEAYVLGEHGDTSLIPWSLTTVLGMNMETYCEVICERQNQCGKLELNDIVDDVRNSGSKIIAAKGATFFAIAAAVSRLCNSVLKDTKEVLTVSTMMHGQYGVEDVCVSLPFVVGAGGIARSFEVPLTDKERAAFIHSANIVKDISQSMTI